jgi:hypothetical protein
LTQQTFLYKQAHPSERSQRLKSRYKKKCFAGLGAGIPLLVASGAICLFSGDEYRPWFVVPLLAGLPFYIWGCVALAKAKGYSTAIVITAVFGLLLPLVILIALPDKNRFGRR